MHTQKKELNFKNQNIYIGFDVHLKSWQVTILTENVNFKTFIMPPKPEILSNYLRRNFPDGNYYSAYEAGFCGFWAHYQLKELGIDNIVVNPADIPCTQKEKIQKDDKRDSKKIARSLRNGELDAIYVPKESTLDDRMLVRTRAMLIKDMTRFKQRIKSFLYFYGIDLPEAFAKKSTHWSKKFMIWLEGITLREQSGREALNALVKEAIHQRVLLLEITKKIQDLAKQPKYANNIDLLRSIPGIGLINSMTIMTEIETIARFANTDKLAGYVGIIPTSHSSGEKEKNGEITFRAHDFLRRVFIESAWVSIRFDPIMLMNYQNFCKRMEPNKAIVRIARKLVNRIFFVLKNQKKYESQKTTISL